MPSGRKRERDSGIGDDSILESEDEGTPARRGFLYPGTNYLGPGNQFPNGEPTSNVDRMAMRHDASYAHAATPEEVDEADAQLMQDAWKEGGLQGIAAAGGMAIKRTAEAAFGSIYPTEEQMASNAAKRGLDQAVESQAKRPELANENANPRAQKGGQAPEPMAGEGEAQGGIGGGVANKGLQQESNLKQPQGTVKLCDSLKEDTVLINQIHFFLASILLPFLWSGPILNKFKQFIQKNRHVDMFQWDPCMAKIINQQQYVVSRISEAGEPEYTPLSMNNRFEALFCKTNNTHTSSMGFGSGWSVNAGGGWRDAKWNLGKYMEAADDTDFYFDEDHAGDRATFQSLKFQGTAIYNTEIENAHYYNHFYRPKSLFPSHNVDQQHLIVPFDDVNQENCNWNNTFNRTHTDMTDRFDNYVVKTGINETVTFNNKPCRPNQNYDYNIRQFGVGTRLTQAESEINVNLNANMNTRFPLTSYYLAITYDQTTKEIIATSVVRSRGEQPETTVAGMPLLYVPIHQWVMFEEIRKKTTENSAELTGHLIMHHYPTTYAPQLSSNDFYFMHPEKKGPLRSYLGFGMVVDLLMNYERQRGYISGTIDITKSVTAFHNQRHNFLERDNLGTDPLANQAESLGLVPLRAVDCPIREDSKDLDLSKSVIRFCY